MVEVMDGKASRRCDLYLYAASGRLLLAKCGHAPEHSIREWLGALASTLFTFPFSAAAILLATKSRQNFHIKHWLVADASAIPIP